MVRKVWKNIWSIIVLNEIIYIMSSFIVGLFRMSAQRSQSVMNDAWLNDRISEHDGVRFYRKEVGLWYFCHEHYLDSADEVVRKWVYFLYDD